MPIILPTSENLSEAAQSLKEGKLVGMPTETVYGLACDATQDRAVAAVYALKNRPSFNPLIIHYASIEGMKDDVVLSPLALSLLTLSCSLTLVLERKPSSKVSFLASQGLPTLAVRIPRHEVARQLIALTGRPIAAPSANPSGKISPTTAQHVAEGFSEGIACIIDGGACTVGLESTILDLTTSVPTLLRPGGTSREELEDIIGQVLSLPQGEIKAPGMLESHYAPDLPVRLRAENVKPDEALLAFGSPLEGAALTLNLSEKEDLVEAAANLFKMLRLLDCSSFQGIAVMNIPNQGLGLAINDRLRRAAAPR